MQLQTQTYFCRALQKREPVFEGQNQLYSDKINFAVTTLPPVFAATSIYSFKREDLRLWSHGSLYEENLRLWPRIVLRRRFEAVATDRFKKKDLRRWPRIALRRFEAVATDRFKKKI